MHIYKRFIAGLLILCTAMLTGAQEAGEIYTFDDGTQFTIPEGGVLDDSGVLPLITIDDSFLIEMVNPGIMGSDVDATLDMPLEEVMDFLLGVAGYEGTGETILSFDLEDEREALAIDFINSSGAFQSIIAIRMSDQRVGAINIRSLEELTNPQRGFIEEFANSFDVVSDEAEAPADVQENISSPEEAALTIGLTEAFSYESGVSFRYPSDYTFSQEETYVNLIIENEIIITLLDPNLFGMPVGQTMDTIAEFIIRETEFSMDDFEAFDIGGREALIAIGPLDDIFNTLVLARFNDTRVGILDVTTLNQPTESHLTDIRAIAASFNSSPASAPAMDEVQFRALYDTGRARYDEREFEEAIEIFTQAIAIDDAFAPAYFWRGASLLRLGQLDESLSEYETALELSPASLNIYTDISMVNVLRDDLGAAISALETQIELANPDELDPQTPLLLELYQGVAAGEYSENYHYTRANYYRQIGLYDQALSENQITIDNSPEDYTLHVQRGVIFMNMGDPSAAVDAFTEGIEVAPVAVVFYNRGFANMANIQNDRNAMINSLNDFECVLILEDGTATEAQITEAQRMIAATIVDSEEYEAITDPANCLP